MIIQPTTVDLPAVEVLAFTDVEIIGTAAGKQYARSKDGRELLVGSLVQPWEHENPPKPHEVRIQRRYKFQDRSMAFPELRTDVTRATVVPPGSFEQAVQRDKAKQEAAARQSNPPPRLLDVLSRHPLLRSQLPTVIRGRSPSNPLLAGSGLLIEGRGPILGVDNIWRVLHSHGVTLGWTEAGAPYWLGPLLDSVGELIDLASPLLYADALGPRLRCELRHEGEPPEADTILRGGTPVCTAHFSGELMP